jgi:hypothetical protein
MVEGERIADRASIYLSMASVRLRDFGALDSSLKPILTARASRSASFFVGRVTDTSCPLIRTRHVQAPEGSFFAVGFDIKNPAFLEKMVRQIPGQVIY